MNFKELWRYRELALFLAQRDLKLRYRQTFFGVAWAILQPVTAATIFSVVFGRLVTVPSDGLPYPVFVLAGLVVWTYVSTGVEQAAQSLTNNRELITKIYCPRLLAPLAAVLPGLIDLGISLLILGGAMAAYGVAPGVAIVLLPVAVAAAVAVTVSVGLWLSALNVQYRDVGHALSFLVQVWFFATPIVYSSSVLDGIWEYVFALNPMVGVIDLFRWSALAGPIPAPADLISLASGSALLTAGAMYFRVAERRFADVV